MKNFDCKHVSVTGGFWADRLELNANVTIRNVYKRFAETGRFAALNCRKSDPPSHIFWDSDVAKWLESAVYILARKQDGELKAIYDETVETILSHQRDDGYFNSYFLTYEPDGIFKTRYQHELYCAGHLFEAAAAAVKLLGDERLLRFSEKYAHYIRERFTEKKDVGFSTPGHEEIELALFKLYDLTKDDKYRSLAEHFLWLRGTKKEHWSADTYSQSHLPIAEQVMAEGHAVRAMYLYCAMADEAAYRKELLNNLEAIFEDICERKEAVTGGLGSSEWMERFTYPYDLPNFCTYNETCAAIGYAFFCHRMFLLTGNAKYSEKIEKLLYNAILSGISLDGKSFFYVNPLEMQIEKVDYNKQFLEGHYNYPIPERVEVFDCSCCPPNVTRLIEQVPELIWYRKDDELILSQYVDSCLSSDFADAEICSGFPYDGKVKVTVDSHGKPLTLRMRVPAWCEKQFENEADGYLIFEICGKQTIELDFEMKLRTIYANPKVLADSGKIAYSYGPLILCGEGADNRDCMQIYGLPECKEYQKNFGSDGIFTVEIPAKKRTAERLYSYQSPEKEETRLKLIPYFAWANRGRNDMRVWFPIDF